MGTIKNFKQFIGESEDMPIQFTTSTLGRTGEIELDDNGDNRHDGSEDHEDHEVGMAKNLLDDIIKNAQELKEKIGKDEMNLPGWIQDHISQSQNYINQANTGYHELSEAAHIDKANAIKAIQKYNRGQFPYNTGDMDLDDLAEEIIYHFGYKKAYYAILPVSDPENDAFLEYCDSEGITNIDLNDEYPTDWLFIHDDKNVLETFIKEYWDESDIKKYKDENDIKNKNIINKYQK